MSKVSCSRSLFPALEAHIAEWSGCRLCDLSHSRTNSVFYRGSLPCTLLFLGDMPDDAATSTGLPFGGPLEKVLNDYVPKGVSFAATYATCCSPSPEKLTGHHLDSCWPRLLSFIGLASPSIVCALGKAVDSYYIRHMGQVLDKLKRRPVYIRVNSPFYTEFKAKDKVQEILRAKLTIQAALDKLK